MDGVMLFILKIDLCLFSNSRQKMSKCEARIYVAHPATGTFRAVQCRYTAKTDFHTVPICGIHRRRLISGKKWFGFMFQPEPKITMSHEMCDEHNYWGAAMYWEPKPE
jgi:hypothetical protein